MSETNLFSQINIRNHQIKNRIVMPPMVCFGFPTKYGIVTEQHLKHYQARAQGGVGLIIVEATCIESTGRLAEQQLGLWSDVHISGLKQIAAICHEYGAKVLVQIHHGGMATAKGVTDDILAPSSYTGKSKSGNPISARALSIREIYHIQQEFIAAAVRAEKAGFDGIELHGAHGYLISQFLSPEVNHRQDEYGGSLNKRTRFVDEIITGIRNATQDDFIIDCRMGGYEPDLESGIQIARILEKAGVDLLHISFGIENFLTQEPAKAHPMPVDFHYGPLVFAGSEIKKNVRVPVIAVGGIRTPLQANDLIKKGMADFTAIGKGMLVDPEWANKAKNQKEVVPCLDCKVCTQFSTKASCPQIKRDEKVGSRE